MDALLRAFLADESGATAIEYGLLIGLIAVAAITAFPSMHIAVEELHMTSSNAMVRVASDAFQ